WLLLGAAAGALVDRIRAMQAAGVVRSAVIIGLAALAAVGAASMWALYAVMFTVMACETVYDTAARAVLPGLVARDRLESANGRLESGRLVTEDFGGAPLAGLLFGVAAALPLAVNGLGYLLAVVLLAGLPATARRAPADPAAGAAAPRTAFRADVVEGPRVLLGDPLQRALPLLSLGVGGRSGGGLPGAGPAGAGAAGRPRAAVRVLRGRLGGRRTGGGGGSPAAHPVPAPGRAGIGLLRDGGGGAGR